MYARPAACLLWLLLLGLSGLAQTPALSPGVPNQPGLASPPLPPVASEPAPAPAAALIPRQPRGLRFTLEAADQAVLRHYKYNLTLPDSLSALREVRALVVALQADAYLTASADELRWGRDTVRVRLYVGPKFRWARLRNGNLGDGLLTRAGYRERFFATSPSGPPTGPGCKSACSAKPKTRAFPSPPSASTRCSCAGPTSAGAWC